MVLGMRINDFHQSSLRKGTNQADGLGGLPDRNRFRRLLAPKRAVERCFNPGDRDRRRPDLAVHGSRQGRVGYVRLASNFSDSVFIREFDERRSDGEQALDSFFGATFGGGELSRLRVLVWASEASGHEKALLLSSERRGTCTSGAILHHCLFWEVAR